MKFLIVFAAICALALAAPRPDEIIHQHSNVDPEGFNFGVELDTGFKHFAQGYLKDIGTDHEAIVVHGYYTWEDDKTGEKFSVEYGADENGFHPTGAHLPVAPVA